MSGREDCFSKYYRKIFLHVITSSDKLHRSVCWYPKNWRCTCSCELKEFCKWNRRKRKRNFWSLLLTLSRFISNITSALLLVLKYFFRFLSAEAATTMHRKHAIVARSRVAPVWMRPASRTDARNERIFHPLNRRFDLCFAVIIPDFHGKGKLRDWELIFVVRNYRCKFKLAVIWEKK